MAGRIGNQNYDTYAIVGITSLDSSQGGVGPTGPQGLQGIVGFGLDGLDGEEGMPIPGPPGYAKGSITFGVASGATGTSVTLPALAAQSGGLTGVSVQVVASDTMAFTFDIKKNGTSIFTSPRSVSGSASPGLYTFTALTSSPLTYAKNDAFTLDITSGSATWKATIVAS